MKARHLSLLLLITLEPLAGSMDKARKQPNNTHLYLKCMEYFGKIWINLETGIQEVRLDEQVSWRRNREEESETGEKLGNLSRRRMDRRQKRWGEEMENIGQGTKKARSGTEQENTEGQLLPGGRGRYGPYLEERQKHLWWEKPVNTTAKHFHCPVVLAEGKFLLPLAQLQWSDQSCELWCITRWHSSFEGFFGFVLKL